MRVVGARLLSPPTDALSAAFSSSLAVCFNGIHRVVVAASSSSNSLIPLKLGRAPPSQQGPLFCPLTAAAEDGGPIAKTAVVVRRVFPEIVWQGLPDGSRKVASPGAARAQALAAEAALEAAGPKVAAVLAREEREHCERLLRLASEVGGGGGGGGATAGEAAYARAFRGGDDEGGECCCGGIDASSRRTNRALDAHCSQRETLRAARALELQQQVLNAAGVPLPVKSRRVWRALVSAAVPAEEAERAERREERRRRWLRRQEEGDDEEDKYDEEDGSSSPSLPSPLEQEWLLQLWEPPGEDSGAPPLPRESQVVWLTSLTPRARWRNDPLSLSRPQLSGGRGTAWGVLKSSSLVFECPARRRVDLSALSSLSRGDDFDFQGTLVAAGPVRCEGVVVASALAPVAAAPATPLSDNLDNGNNASSSSASSLRPPDAEQWLFLADDAALSLLDSGVPAEEVWLLAVRVSGPLAAAPFLFPPPPQATTKGNSSSTLSSSPASLAGLSVRIRDARLALAPDDRERLWRAEARDTAVVALVGRGGGNGGRKGGGREMSGSGARAVEAFGSRVAALLGS